MLEVSELFKQKVEADQRRFKPAVMIHMLPEGNSLGATVQATSYRDGTTRPSQVANGRLAPSDSVGTGQCPPSLMEPHKGWWSGNISDENGVFQTPEQITVTYDKPMQCPNIWWISERGYFPKDFTVEVLVGGTWQIIAEVTDHPNPTWYAWLEQSPMVAAVRMTIYAMATGYNPVRLLHFGRVGTIILEEDDLIDFQLLEEGKSPSAVGFGSVTSNEFTVTIRNDHAWFTPTTENTPFRGMMSYSVQFEGFLGLEVSPNVFEYVPLGKFKSLDWDSGGVHAKSLTGFDRIHTIREMDVPPTPMLRDTTIYDLFILLFTALGLAPEEYLVDKSLRRYKVPIGFLPPGTAGECMEILAEAGLCYVTTNRQGKIWVRNAVVSKQDPIMLIHEDNLVVTADNPYKYLQTFNRVEVKYAIPTLATGEDLLDIQDLRLTPGINRFESLALNSFPADEVSFLNVSAPEGVLITSTEVGTSSIQLELHNTTGRGAHVGVIVRGKFYEFPRASAFITSKDAVGDIRTHTIENDLIQDRDMASVYGHSLLSIVAQAGATITAELRGLPHLELFDVIEIRDTTTNIPQMKIIPIRHTLRYDGGVSSQLEATLPMDLLRTVFVKPGFPITVVQQIGDATYDD